MKVKETAESNLLLFIGVFWGIVWSLFCTYVSLLIHLFLNNWYEFYFIKIIWFPIIWLTSFLILSFIINKIIKITNKKEKPIPLK